MTFFESSQFKNTASFLAYSFPVLAFRMLSIQSIDFQGKTAYNFSHSYAAYTRTGICLKTKHSYTIYFFSQLYFFLHIYLD